MNKKHLAMKFNYVLKICPQDNHMAMPHKEKHLPTNSSE
ncbi:unnamed protein product [Tenebrio molitor]|nr:unnamed protein product [Tenebrio molitor]